MASFRELTSVAKPVLSAAANLMAALDEQKAGRSGNAMFLHCGSDLFEAVGQAYTLITASTSNGKDLAPSRPVGMNLSGQWQGEGGAVSVYHDEDTGLLMINEGGANQYIGAAQAIGTNTKFVATCQTHDGRNMLWHGVGGRNTMATTLWDWDNKTNMNFRLDRG